MKVFYAALISLLTTATLNAQQPFSPPGASWHYDFNALGSGGFTRYTYLSDTLLNNQLCKIIQPVLFTFYIPGSAIHNTDTLPNRFVYLSGDTVFYYFNNTFFKLFNFGAAVGDEWQVADSITFQHCDTNSYVHVDSIGTMIVDGQTLRWISVHPIGHSPYGYNGKIIERIGPVGGNDLFPKPLNCDTQIIAEIPLPNFHCYQDNQFALYNVEPNECEYLLYVGIDSPFKNSSAYTFYPSLFSEHLIFEQLHSEIKNKNIIIYNAQLEKVIETNSSERLKEINTSSLPSGIYFAMVNDINLVFYYRLVKY